MKYSVFIITLATGALLGPLAAFGQQEFIPMVGIPGVPTNAVGIEPYINALFMLAIAAAGILAVVKIIMAGMKYMFSEVVTNKEEAKKDIQGAVLGLLLILGGVTILNEINPKLTSFDALSKAPVATVESDFNSSTGSNVGESLPVEGLTDDQIRIFSENCQGSGNITTQAGGNISCNAPGSAGGVVITCPEGTSLESYIGEDGQEASRCI